MSRERAELVGKVIDGRYLVGRTLAVGGTGVVFDVEHLETGEHFVLKAMRPVYAQNTDLQRRLLREAEVSRNVHHSGIVPVVDEGTLYDGSPYIVMEKVHGMSLSRLLLRVGRLSVEETALIAVRVSSVLHAAHAQGYVHRDIKPEHVIFEEQRGGGLQVWVLDFGVCAAATAPADEKERERGRVFGTPTYCSPEQASGLPEVDGRADIFGLAVTMFECLTGRVPFTGHDVNDLLRRIIRCETVRVSDVVPGLAPEIDEVVARAMTRAPADRFLTARAFSRALVPLAGARIDVEQKLLSRVAGSVVQPITEDAPTLDVASPAGIRAA